MHLRDPLHEHTCVVLSGLSFYAAFFLLIDNMVDVFISIEKLLTHFKL